MKTTKRNETDNRKNCKDCVFWILRNCQETSNDCKYKETYEDWDKDDKLLNDFPCESYQF